MKRAVWERDAGRCTFVSESGHRCESCTRLEFDHVEPVATGGHATVQGLRLRCRAHNQLEAERAFGRDFMNAKRDQARREQEQRGTEAQHAAAVQCDSEAQCEVEARRDAGAQRIPGGKQPLPEHVAEIVPWLRTLGFRAEEARGLAACCADMPDAPLEARVRHALKCSARPTRGRVA